MIFSELYSAYYNAVSAILSLLLDGVTDEKKLQKTVLAHAFGESALTILPSLKNGDWQLMHPDFTTPIKHKPTMPLTNLQKQWLKAISLDKRICLFGVQFDGLEDVEPLFTEEDYDIYDRYADGDPYDDAEYVSHFRTILQALRERRQICLKMQSRHGRTVSSRCFPVRLEYSEKDDKFRLVTSGCRYLTVANLANIQSVELTGVRDTGRYRVKTEYKEFCLRIKDERNALERCMMHFAHFEKRAEKLDSKHYLVRIRYDKNDESELAIRVLSFGPMVEVTEPSEFRHLIAEKLKKQAKFF